VRRGSKETVLELPLADEPGAVLFADRLRDGRLAIGTRRRDEAGEWTAGEMHLLQPAAGLALAGWLSAMVDEEWLGTIRERQAEPLRTAGELYGQGRAGVERLALEMMREIPPGLIARGLMLLANSIGPEARERLIQRLNSTDDTSEDQILRRRLADEREAFAYVVAAAALFDALETGIANDEPPGEEL